MLDITLIVTMWVLLVVLTSLLVSSHGHRVVNPPIVDIQNLWNSVDSAVVNQLEHAFINHGLAILKGVNISTEERIAYFNAVQELMDLEEHDKMSVRVNSSKAIGRGYLPIGSESGLAEYIEPKEGYSYGYPSEHTEHNKLTSPNIWPAGLSSQSVQVLSDLFIKFSKICNLIMHSIVSYRNSLNIPSQAINIASEKGAEISLLRVFHYFHTQSPQYLTNINPSSNPGTPLTNAIGSSPHTDWGLLTLIMPNHVSGLQYINEGKYMGVPSIPDTVVVNVGDFFSLATKGEYHSPIHRVLSPVNENRMSFVYFFYPDYDTLLTLPPTSAEYDEDCAGRESGGLCGPDNNGVCSTKKRLCAPYQEQYNT
ncbi:isopenicillin N synthase family oxygenase, partial [archaeon]